MKIDCQLCRDLSDANREFWNLSIFETADFSVVPSLGALLPGWLLVVPKEHYISVGAFPASLRARLRKTVEWIYAQVEDAFGDACIFEHGPATENRAVGCGVDHAHVHIAPLPFPLESAARPFLPDGTIWQTATLDQAARAHKAGADYLYIEQTLGRGRIAIKASFGSQLLRRAISERLGVGAQFNWREHPQLDNVTATVREFRRRNLEGMSVRVPIRA
jgi:diadenosine tetraphosphate (Ap4A) HIT family hydrolase